MTGTVQADQCTFFIVSRSVFLRMRNASDKRCIENQNGNFVLSKLFSTIVPFMR